MSQELQVNATGMVKLNLPILCRDGAFGMSLSLHKINRVQPPLLNYGGVRNKRRQTCLQTEFVVLCSCTAFGALQKQM